MKKSLLTAGFLLLFLACFALSSGATPHDGLCGCGREFATEDSDRYMIYDCLGCGRNFTSCTCHTCWCGSDMTVTETESGITVYTCLDCSLPCEECVCRDRSYYDALRNVEQGLTGEEIPNPDNGILVFLAVSLPFALFLGAYFTVYRRRSATRARRDRAPDLERILDRIDKESNAKLRYEMAKKAQAANQNGRTYVPDRDGKILCFRKNELLSEALEEDRLSNAAETTLRTCRRMNEFGFVGSVETIDRLWDFRKKAFANHREEISGETPAQSLIKWDTNDPRIALFETITPLNGKENNLLPPASNITRFTACIFEQAPSMKRKTDSSTEQEQVETLRRILPEGDLATLTDLPRRTGEFLTPPAGLPEEASPKRMGDRNRFTGGIKK